MNNKTMVALLVLTLAILCVCSSCAINKKETKLSIAYQYGISYAPMIFVKELKLIEKHYGEPVNINWQILNSGSAINEGVVAGDIDVACMGIAPFITGVSKNVGYKLFSAMSGQPMGLNTINPNLKTLSDFTSDDKIALVSYGSIQHIMLGMAAEKELGDAHALDQLIINMAHPDGMQSLLSKSVAAHLTTSPYYNIELARDDVWEIESVAESFPDGCTIIIAAATEKLYKENKKLYDALVNATQEAIDYINNNIYEVALFLCESEGISVDDMERYLNDEDCVYKRIPNGVLEVADFMGRAGFAQNVPTTLDEVYFDDLLKIAQEQ